MSSKQNEQYSIGCNSKIIFDSLLLCRIFCPGTDATETVTGNFVYH